MLQVIIMLGIVFLLSMGFYLNMQHVKKNFQSAKTEGKTNSSVCVCVCSSQIARVSALLVCVFFGDF